ncbi:MAG: FMN-binding protein [Aggregatilineales bacterium]
MSKTRPVPQTPNFSLAARKFGLSFLLILSFMAYAIRARLVGDTGTTPAAPQSNPSNASNASSASSSTNQGAVSQPTVAPASNRYKDGQYTGQVADAFYGNVQVKVIIQGSRITDVQWLDYPHDRRTSQEINYQATPWLKSEAIQAQNAQVDIISGATLTSEAFIQSLGSALTQAQS